MGVPALLVGVHIAGATAVWTAAVHFLLSFSAVPTTGAAEATVAPGRSPALTSTG
jgi:hypothetical protein